MSHTHYSKRALHHIAPKISTDNIERTRVYSTAMKRISIIAIYHCQAILSNNSLSNDRTRNLRETSLNPKITPRCIETSTNVADENDRDKKEKKKKKEKERTKGRVNELRERVISEASRCVSYQQRRQIVSYLTRRSFNLRNLEIRSRESTSLRNI